MLGLGLSLSHCFFMCGGILLLFNQNKSSIIELLIYHFFRIFAYTLIGMLAYLLGFFISSLNFQIFLYFFLGLFCILLGFALISRGILLSIIENQYIYKKLINLLKKAKNFKARAMIYGFLNGLFPCGLVYFFVAKSIMAKSISEAALNMLVFGLSTLPALLSGGILIQKIRKIQNIQYLFFSLIIVYGFYLCYLALKLSQP